MCDDIPTNRMTENGFKCISKRHNNPTSDFFKRKCTDNDKWKKNKFCQQTCFNLGYTYDGEVCCSAEPGESPSLMPSQDPTPKPSADPSTQPTIIPSRQPSSYPTIPCSGNHTYFLHVPKHSIEKVTYIPDGRVGLEIYLESLNGSDVVFFFQAEDGIRDA